MSLNNNITINDNNINDNVDNSNGNNNEIPSDDYPVTQKLIEKYYEMILGCPKIRHHELVFPSEFAAQNSNNMAITTTILRKCNRYVSKCWSLMYNVLIGDYEKNLLVQKLLSEKKHAMSYNEWKIACTQLDTLTNNNNWKEIEESSYYDYKLIKQVTSKLRHARLNKDFPQLVYLIRTNWVRNLGNMGNVNLYRYSHVGTKYLIDDYMNESRLCIEALLHQSELDDTYLLGMLQQTRRNIGRTALVLSGGGTFGLFHIGVLSTLSELDILPRVISGSSAGAIVASILSVYHKDELPELFERVLGTDFNIFKDDSLKSESENFLIKFSRFFKNGTWFDNKHLGRTMIEFLSDLTFREAYNRTGKILNITVSPASLFEQPRLLNNLTAPNVLIWSAVCASCSLPGIFPSSPLYEKDPKTGETREWIGSSSVKFVDGSVDNDLPISRLSEMFNVDHIIACQVNIHVFPILKLSLSCVGGDIEDELSAKIKQGLTNVYNYMANEAMHFLELGCEVGLAKNALTKMRSVLSQQYSGDITILPDLNMLCRINKLLSNPSTEFILRETTNGARATWPKISIIQNHCGQEFALERAISFLKGRILMSSTIKNPIQFADIPVGLVKYAIDKLEGDQEDKISKTLDDNLLETESTNSLLLLRENSSAKRRFSSVKSLRPATNILLQRRKSDTLPRSRLYPNSVSFVEAYPNSKWNRENNKATHYRPHIYHRRSTEHLSSWRHKHSPYKDNKPYSQRSISPNLRRGTSQITTSPAYFGGFEGNLPFTNPTTRSKVKIRSSAQRKGGRKGKKIFFTESDNEEMISQKSSPSEDSQESFAIDNGNDDKDIHPQLQSESGDSSNVIINENAIYDSVEQDNPEGKIEYLGDVVSNQDSI
ncbi:hypothetical protein Kpol_1043p61 [Vanderwaltozyma polyspora DSM 70294]|uniref:PNPLA domain-containing protein n=1 Tax=Vanderwaltozyma polyspora (strain ATCC 22028 / DSM 70294 / BCRC 21397 / CBS 2163 / NBRC 10782 / NRRL Y-8283 / UCD 57-17) TaxID=436907 RepID=A7TIS9_VANPO|nr:uncharacterized protein Kpol_1043p61 [Vanderwaltozyma polyspora DSM 70294]EDO17871.1 hypothetical protein Kpol_1043p61 [Vanderwaltozyma polyspora DSM 70294]